MTSSSIRIRAYQPSDLHFVRQLLTEAFDTDLESRLTEALRDSENALVELIAVWDRNFAGHILFSNTNGLEPMRVAGLGPMAVLATHRSRGIGSALVNAGCDRCRELGYHAVVVLGHPQYYPRFGFQPASVFGIRSEYDVPVEVFMLKWLDRPANPGSGIVRYHPLFNEISE